MTALMLASQSIDPKLVKLLLEEDNICLDFQQNHGSTALMLACARSTCEGADLLTRCGANVNLRDACGRPALRILANNNARAWRSARLLADLRGTAKLLVDRGAEVDVSHIPSVNAGAALAVACRQGYMEVIQLLGDEYHIRSGKAGATGDSLGMSTRKTRQRTSSREWRKTRKLS